MSDPQITQITQMNTDLISNKQKLFVPICLPAIALATVGVICGYQPS